MAPECAVNYYTIVWQGPYDEAREKALSDYYKTLTYSRVRVREGDTEYCVVGVMPSEFDTFRRCANAAAVSIYNDSRYEERVW